MASLLTTVELKVKMSLNLLWVTNILGFSFCWSTVCKTGLFGVILPGVHWFGYCSNIELGGLLICDNRILIRENRECFIENCAIIDFWGADFPIILCLRHLCILLWEACFNHCLLQPVTSFLCAVYIAGINSSEKYK